MALLIYVDDLVLTGNNSKVRAKFKRYLNSCFQIKDLGPLKYFLGIEVARGSQRLFLCQRKYVLEIIECRLLGAKPVEFPMETKHKLALATGPQLDDATWYKRLVGRLIYLTIMRLELCNAVHVLSQFMHDPKEEYMKIARRVLKYLKGGTRIRFVIKK